MILAKKACLDIWIKLQQISSLKLIFDCYLQPCRNLLKEDFELMVLEKNLELHLLELSLYEVHLGASITVICFF